MQWTWIERGMSCDRGEYPARVRSPRGRALRHEEGCMAAPPRRQIISRYEAHASSEEPAAARRSAPLQVWQDVAILGVLPMAAVAWQQK